MIDSLIIVGLFSVIVYGLIKIQKNKNIFRKVNLQGNEIEIFEENDESYFDKYLNEVLYLFENTDADVIVFEDMDRFDANKIFERLREVNTLANIQLRKENKKVLRFFYLLRDDIFVSKDRTKFFDYIIPVVPVLDGSNSYDQFIALFKKSGLFEEFDENFLQGLSLYIDDMRLLKNIYNEFLIYYNTLNITELDCNKMLAIIAYKNIFPRDFADLQLNRGFVYTLFSKKDEFINFEITKIRELIDQKKQKITSCKDEHLVSTRELDAVFADRYLKCYNLSSKSDNELSQFIVNYLNQDQLNEYESRKQALEDKLEGAISQLNNEIYRLEQEIAAIKNKRLCEIITRDNIDRIFDDTTSTNAIGEKTEFKEIKRSEYFDLLKYLIRYGHIDETYADYMTYFYENSLSRIDKTFLRSVTDKKAKEYTYQLNNPRLVVSYLRPVDFDQEEILNFDLLTYLLHTQSQVEYLKRFIDQLRDSKNFQFISEYLDTTTDLSTFIKFLNIEWPELFAIAFGESALTEKQLRRYSINSIYYSDDEILESINKDKCLCDYISNARDFLAIEEPKIDQLIHGFTLLKVCFVGFNYEELNKNLFHAVYENSLYEINSENLQLIQREILRIQNVEDILHKNYTLLLSYPDSAITQYISRNINKYFDVVIQMSTGTIKDDEKIAIAVLNNSDLTIEHKYSYISALQTIIISIKEITDHSLWSPLLDASIVHYSEYNIMDCFRATKLNHSLIDYINRCDTNLDFTKTEYDENTRKTLSNAVIACNSIENSKYKQILISLRVYYDIFEITGVSHDKINILIDTNIIRMTAENLDFMRENYPEQIFRFIHQNIEEYVDGVDSELFSQNELLEILTWDINDELKIELLEFSNKEISIVGKNYSSAVCLYILEYNFMESDLDRLFSSYEQWDNSIQAKIFDFALKNIQRIISNPKMVSTRLKDDLIRSNRLSRDIIIDLLIEMMSDLGKEHIIETLNLLGLTDYARIFDTRSRPKFEINDENEKLLTAFKEKGLICNFEENLEREGYYKIARSRQTKS